MNPDRLLTHYARIAEAPDAIGRLRRFILDLAVRGKIVPQEPRDEPASDLLLQIGKEKAQRGIRHDVVPLELEEIPFKLPPGWSWSRIGEVCSKTGSGSTPRGGQAVYRETGVPFLRSQNVYNDGLRLDDVAYIDAETHSRMAGTAVKAGDLLLNITGGSMGRCCRVPDTFGEANVSQHVAIVRSALPGLGNFLHRLILSPYFQAFIFDEQTGAGRGGLPKNRMDRIAVALPPLSEQHRIVSKVEELMDLCNQLEVARARRESTRDRLTVVSLARLNAPDSDTLHDDARFVLNALPVLTARPDQVKKLRQTILNLAVRGILVPQDPKDEPVSALLQRISGERSELVSMQIVRREQPLKPIGPKDPPFSLPDNWAWSRIGDAVLFTQYGTSLKSQASNSGVPVLTMGNIQDGMVTLDSEKTIPHSSDDLPALYLRKFDILYNRTNSAELVGKTGIYVGENDVRTFASYLIRLRTSETSICPKYLNMAMNSPVFRETQILPLIKKQTGQANVNGSALKCMLVPIPPLAEQHRIVAKVDELMMLCDRLGTSLSAGANFRGRLLDTLLLKSLEPGILHDKAA